ncbi:MAG: radical SAM protein, partial [Polyangia bacterium]|nr:radical SAM protein [Polyangia bacterium]
MSDWPDLDRMDPELVRRYDQRGPRYTSYPTAPHFSKGFDSEALLGRIRGTSAGAAPPALSIYLHVPYCPQKCLYCGCHSVAIGCPEEPASYAEALKQELELWLGLLGPGRRQAQLAFGGGSPSTLGAEALQGLVAALDRAFPPEPGAERSLELDPGRVDETYLGVLLDLGFTRLSFGIQDFEPEVLKKVGRREDPATVSRHLGYLRSRGFDAVSFDLMLGLPSQSVETLRGTLEKVVSLRPSRLALFPYA